MFSKSLKTRALGAIAIVLLIAGVGAVAIAQMTPVTLTSLIPKELDFVGSIQANWVWDVSASIRNTPAAAKAIATAEAQSGLSFQNDVIPWAGQVAMAGSEIDKPTAKVIMYFEIRDAEKFKAMLDKLNAKAKADGSASLVTRDYKGTTIYDIKKKAAPAKPAVSKGKPFGDDCPASFAVVNGWAIAGIGTGAIEHALDVAAGRAASIKDDPAWGAVLAHLTPNTTGWAGINTGALMATAAQNMPKGKIKASREQLATSQSLMAFALTDEGNGFRVDTIAAPETTQAKAIYSQMGRNLPPVTDKILRKVPDSVLVGLISNPAYYYTLAKTMAMASATTPKEKKEILKQFKQAKPMEAEIQHFKQDAGFSITWRKDRGFGIVMLAEADTHVAALAAAKTIAGQFTAMKMPLQRGGNSWSMKVPVGAVPPGVPVKLAPFMSAKDDWVIIGSSPSWTAVQSTTPNLQLPANSSHAMAVGELSMRWLPAALDLVQLSARPGDTDADQGIALARGLGLETSLWTSSGTIAPTGDWSEGTFEVTNWNWRAAIDTTVQAIKNWKPAKPQKGDDVPKKATPDVS